MQLNKQYDKLTNVGYCAKVLDCLFIFFFFLLFLAMMFACSLLTLLKLFCC